VVAGRTDYARHVMPGRAVGGHDGKPRT
jgi:hypothetical protein